jgi:hypothetical protein
VISGFLEWKAVPAPPVANTDKGYISLVNDEIKRLIYQFYKNHSICH